MPFGVLSGIGSGIGVFVLDGGPHATTPRGKGVGSGGFSDPLVWMAFLSDFLKKKCIRIVRDKFIIFPTALNWCTTRMCIMRHMLRPVFTPDIFRGNSRSKYFMLCTSPGCSLRHLPRLPWRPNTHTCIYYEGLTDSFPVKLLNESAYLTVVQNIIIYVTLWTPFSHCTEFIFITLPLGGLGAKYCDEYVCLSVCPFT